MASLPEYVATHSPRLTTCALKNSTPTIHVESTFSAGGTTCRLSVISKRFVAAQYRKLTTGFGNNNEQQIRACSSCIYKAKLNQFLMKWQNLPKQAERYKGSSVKFLSRPPVFRRPPQRVAGLSLHPQQIGETSFVSHFCSLKSYYFQAC